MRPASTATFNRDRYSEMSSQPSVHSGLPIVSVLHQFQGENEDELSVNIGDRVQILQVLDGNEWAACRMLEGGLIGMVPVSFLAQFS